MNFDDAKVRSDLYVMAMGDFDIILGMDWLMATQATINCLRREVAFREPGGREVHFYGAKPGAMVPIIAAVEAVKMMRKKDCQAFLVSLIKEEERDITIEEVPIVCEFPDVFPKDLPGLPLNRQVEFTIDLELGAAPISKAPCRMAPKELQELKVLL